MNRATSLCVGAAAAALALLPLFPVHGDELLTPEERSECGSTDFSQGKDYRNRGSRELAWNFEDNKRYHYDPAVARIRAGEYSRNVMADLDFTLVRWPNHAAALQALVEYELGGGKQYEFLPVTCYFIRARQFAPDDFAVPLLQAYRYWQLRDIERANRSYHLVLDLNPNSPEAHYNLGLLYVEMRDFEAAVEHARKAYGAGFPLPGLRRQLQRAGYDLHEPNHDATDAP